MLGRLLALVVVFGPAVAQAAEAPVLVLNNTNDAPFTTPRGDGFLDRVAHDAFARAGRRVRLVTLPPERGLRNANEGVEDGDLTRIAGMGQAYPNLVPVPEKLIDWRFSAFTRHSKLTVTKGWNSLLPYSVGIIKGWKIAEANLAKARRIVYVDDAEQLFRLLTKNRVDAVVYSREMGQLLLRQHEWKNVRLVEPPLESREMFIYLHKKHAPLIPDLARALRAVKADGSYERYYRESVTQVLARP